MVSATKAGAKMAQQVTTSRGHKYTLTAKGQKLNPEELSGHGKEIYQALKEGPATVAEIEEKAHLKTNSSSPRRLIASYATNWKKAGLLKFAPAGARRKAAEAPQ